MQRAAAILGDQVGGVDQRGDGFHAHAFQTVLHPFGRRAVLDAADQPSGENRAGILVLGREIQADGLGRGGTCPPPAETFSVFKVPKPAAARSRAMPKTLAASPRLGVMATSNSGSLAKRPAVFQRRDDRRADFRSGLQLDDAVMIFAQQELAGAAHHAARSHAANGAQFQHIAGGGNHGAGPGQHHLDAGAGIGRAADDLQRVPAGRLTLHSRKLVGIGMLFGGDDLADNEILQRRAGIADTFDFQTRWRSALSAKSLQHSASVVQMFFQPGEGELHRVSPPSSVGISSAAKP